MEAASCLGDLRSTGTDGFSVVLIAVESGNCVLHFSLRLHKPAS